MDEARGRRLKRRLILNKNRAIRTQVEMCCRSEVDHGNLFDVPISYGPGTSTLQRKTSNGNLFEVPILYGSGNVENTLVLSQLNDEILQRCDKEVIDDNLLDVPMDVMVEEVATDFIPNNASPMFGSTSHESNTISDDVRNEHFIHLSGITMSKGYSFLDQISDAKETWRIRVRICRMWKAVNKRSRNNFISLDMIFIDEKKNLMHAIVRKNVFQKFSAILREGGTFIISNFKVIVTNKGYRPVSNDLNIIFLLTTSVKECNEESELIPMHAFEFAKYNCINNRLNDNSYLTDKLCFEFILQTLFFYVYILADLIGKLTAVGPIEQVHFDSGSTNIRNL
ncbi:hypothetical protein CFP56_006867 [Quercus suber]|uniref:Replication protein A 70 kDa DNA-binding subunit B/D first OB fold domain-containing protein n=1 Tax=Quercus suber TaxID=58331 RepID=A0AAW0M7U0_QUESU